MKSKWISVKDRLPEGVDDMLVFCDSDGYYGIAYYDDGAWRDYVGESIETTLDYIRPVTHWTTLEPPK